MPIAKLCRMGSLLLGFSVVPAWLRVAVVVLAVYLKRDPDAAGEQHEEVHALPHQDLFRLSGAVHQLTRAAAPEPLQTSLLTEKAARLARERIDHLEGKALAGPAIRAGANVGRGRAIGRAARPSR